VRHSTLSLLVTVVSAATASAAGDGVRLGGAWFEGPVRRAVSGAALRLAEPSCARVFTAFRDASGRGLEQRLAELDRDAASYARLVLFYDGTSDGPCRRPRRYAFTVPGSRVVRVCPLLGQLAVAEPERAQAVVIHELLHTLGLQEDQPSSDQITAVVEKHCSR
jgi:hypothetical protein